MRLTLVLGGARSGKTRWALEEARRLGGDDVSYVATADRAWIAVDDEMARRIARHRVERPAAWQTVEESRDPGLALEAAIHQVVVFDCLTMLLSSQVAAADSEAAAAAAGEDVTTRLVASASRLEGELIIVANEVGQGVVPVHPAGRWFRDVQGRANQEVARAAERVVLMAAGIPLLVKGAR